MKGIIFNTEIEAKAWDWHHNTLKGSVTKYKYARKLLEDTTTLTKAQYASLLGIPSTITDEEGNETPNPKYTALSGITLNKCALIVNDALNQYDEEGNVTGYACPKCGEVVDVVVDITEDMLKEVSSEV